MLAIRGHKFVSDLPRERRQVATLPPVSRAPSEAGAPAVTSHLVCIFLAGCKPSPAARPRSSVGRPRPRTSCRSAPISAVSPHKLTRSGSMQHVTIHSVYPLALTGKAGRDGHPRSLSHCSHWCGGRINGAACLPSRFSLNQTILSNTLKSCQMP